MHSKEKRVKIFIEEDFSGLQHQKGRIDMIHELEEGHEVELQEIHNENWKNSLN